jgi:hypothetical protein
LACALAHAEPSRPIQTAGLELGFLSVPVAVSDPYSFAASAGLWYERGLGRSPFGLGAWLAASGFRSLDSGFGSSFMYAGGIEAGYRLLVLRDGDSEVSLRPLARLGWYLRSLEIGGATEWGSRPIASAGCALDLKLGGIDAGLSLLVSMPMDNAPVLLVGLTQRLGLWL